MDLPDHNPRYIKQWGVLNGFIWTLISQIILQGRYKTEQDQPNRYTKAIRRGPFLVPQLWRFKASNFLLDRLNTEISSLAQVKPSKSFTVGLPDG